MRNRMMQIGLCIVVTAVGLVFSSGDGSANTIRTDLKHRHENYGHVYDYDDHNPRYYYSGGWPYVAAATVGMMNGQSWTHTHGVVPCTPGCSN
jgi:hypothetical protein